MTLKSGLIDLSSYTLDELKINNLMGNVLAIQTEGNPSITVKGKHSDLNSLVELWGINLSTLNKEEPLTGVGSWIIAINGLDEIELTVSGSGKIHWKELSE